MNPDLDAPAIVDFLDKQLVGYLTRDEIEAVLTAPDQSTWIGRRDYALLLTMYKSGARLFENDLQAVAQHADEPSKAMPANGIRFSARATLFDWS